MTDQYSRNITPDYMTGLVSAFEGIKDSLVLINGPLGCRFYHAYASGQSIIKAQELWSLQGDLRIKGAMDDNLRRSQYHAGVAEVPGSNLRYEDYIFGTREQLHRALNDIFSERKYSIFSVIQSPGTSLLGEDLEQELKEISEEFGIPYIFMESPALSENLYLGYDDGIVRILKLLLKEKAGVKQKTDEKSKTCTCRDEITDINKSACSHLVNLFGFYTYARYLEGDATEIKRLLSLCGIQINCMMGANSRIEEVKMIPEAELNILMSPERCCKTGLYLREAMDLPVLELEALPIGFDLTETFIKKVCSCLDLDPSPALLDIEKNRARAFYYIARYMGSRGFPKDLRYGAEGEWSMLAGYVDYFSGYLGMKASVLHPLYTECSEKGKQVLQKMAQAYQLEDALGNKIEKLENAFLLGNANTILEVMTYSKNICGIETSSPSSGYIHVIPKTHLGCSGALYLLEQVLNGVKLLKAWQ